MRRLRGQARNRGNPSNWTKQQGSPWHGAAAGFPVAFYAKTIYPFTSPSTSWINSAGSLVQYCAPRRMLLAM